MMRKNKIFPELKIEELVAAVRTGNSDGHLHAIMVLIMLRCQLSMRQLFALQWEQIDLELGFLSIQPPGLSKVEFEPIYPLFSSELTLLRKLRLEQPNAKYIFTSSQKKPLTESAFRKIIRCAQVRRASLDKDNL